MDTTLQIRSSVEQNIRTAFRGVTLGAGISLRRAQLIDSQNAPSSEHTQSFAQKEIIGDWSQVPLDELERDSVAHLDALGFRYYIPALMLSVLEHYDASSMRVIGTLAGLYPKKDNAWEYHMQRYSLLDATQKTAIARFLAELPKLIELDSEGQRTVERALRNYWGEYLRSNATGSLKIGSRVRLIGIPDGLEDYPDLPTKSTFEKCIGREFFIAGFNEVGMAELGIQSLTGSEGEKIWVETQFLELVSK